MFANRYIGRKANEALHAYDLTAEWFAAAGYTQTARVQRYTAAGWLCSCPSHAVLATAGTVGPGTLPRMCLQWLDHVDPTQLNVGGGQKVHAIWYARAQGYAAEIALAAAAMGVVHLDLVGHSYGGALSALLPELLAGAGLVVDRVVTFGCPRVANQAYADALPCPLLRVERDNDIVPWIPLSTPAWLLGLAWQAVFGVGGLVLPHGVVALSYAPAGQLIWCGDETDPPRLVTDPTELSGLALRRFGLIVQQLLRPGTALAVAAGHLMDRYAAHVSIPVP